MLGIASRKTLLILCPLTICLSYQVCAIIRGILQMRKLRARKLSAFPNVTKLLKEKTRV